MTPRIFPPLDYWPDRRRNLCATRAQIGGWDQRELGAGKPEQLATKALRSLETPFLGAGPKYRLFTTGLDSAEDYLNQLVKRLQSKTSDPKEKHRVRSALKRLAGDIDFRYLDARGSPIGAPFADRIGDGEEAVYAQNLAQMHVQYRPTQLKPYEDALQKIKEALEARK